MAYLADHAGGYRAIQERGIEALTTGVHLEYLRAAYFDDVLTVHLRCVDVRGARSLRLCNERAGETARPGTRRTQRSIERPAHRRECRTGSPRRSLRLRGRGDPDGRGTGQWWEARSGRLPAYCPCPSSAVASWSRSGRESAHRRSTSATCCRRARSRPGRRRPGRTLVCRGGDPTSSTTREPFLSVGSFVCLTGTARSR